MLGRAGVGAAGGGAGGTAAQRLAPPTHRVPGASIAARASSAGNSGGGQVVGGPRQAGAAGGQGRGQDSSTSTFTRNTATTADDGRPSGGTAGDDATDDDGFQPVRRRGWRRARDSGGRGDELDADADGDCGDGQEGGADAGDAQGGEAGVGGDNGPPTPRTLRRVWQDEVAIVRRLKGQGLAGEHPAMQAACAARDAAERSWREAKDPAPPAVRLARAQARLDRAIEIQSEAHRALCDYEKEHAEKLAALRSRLEEDRARVRTRRQQLEAIQEEVGAEGMGARVRARQGAAAKQVHTALCNTVAPTIAALVEQLDSSTPAWGVLNGLLGTLADSKSVLEKAFVPGPAAQSYDIAGGG